MQWLKLKTYNDFLTYKSTNTHNVLNELWSWDADLFDGPEDVNHLVNLELLYGVETGHKQAATSHAISEISFKCYSLEKCCLAEWSNLSNQYKNAY